MWTAPPTHQLLTLCVPSHWTRTGCVSRRPSCLYVLLILLSSIVLQPALQAVGLDEVTPCTSDSLADSVAHCTVDREVVINIAATEDQRMVPMCLDVSTAGAQGEKGLTTSFQRVLPTAPSNFADDLRLLPAVPDHLSVDDHCLRNTQSV